MHINGYDTKMKVCVIGLGQIGFPVAKYIATKGLDVTVTILTQPQLNTASKWENSKPPPNGTKSPKADAYVICVTTGQINNQPDLNSGF